MNEEVIESVPFEPEDKSIKKFVYIIHMINTRFYKIGYASNLQVRFSDIYNAVPFELKIIYSKEFKYFLEIEKYIHNFFAKKHYKGEWFELMAEDIYEIISFLKKLEKSKKIKSEINGRLILQKKYKYKRKHCDQIGLTKTREKRYNGYTKPKYYKGDKDKSLISFSVWDIDANKWKRFLWTCGINYEKDLQIRAIKAQNLINKILRLLESGINPIQHKEVFREYGFKVQLDKPIEESEKSQVQYLNPLHQNL